MSGFEVAAGMRATLWGRSIRLVALTGMGQTTDREETASAGFYEHLTKPARLDDVLRLAAGDADNVLAFPPPDARRAEGIEGPKTSWLRSPSRRQPMSS